MEELESDRDRRVQFRFSGEAYRQLENLSQREGRSMTQVVRRGLAKEKWFLDTIEAGHEILVRRTDGKTVKIIPTTPEEEKLFDKTLRDDLNETPNDEQND